MYFSSLFPTPDFFLYDPYQESPTHQDKSNSLHKKSSARLSDKESEEQPTLDID